MLSTKCYLTKNQMAEATCYKVLHTVPVTTRMNILINLIVKNCLIDRVEQKIQNINASGNLW